MFRLCRVAARAAPRSLAKPAPRLATPAFQYLHTGIPSRNEEKAAVPAAKDVAAADDSNSKIVLTPGYIVDKLGLHDWRRSLPLGIFLAIPAIVHEWFIIDEEAMLAGVFILFFGTIHAKFGADIGAYLDKQTDTWLAWRNAMEDAEMEKVVECMTWHKNRMDQLEICNDLIALQRVAMKKSAKAATLKQPHVTRDAIISMLDAAVAQEANEWNTNQTALIQEAIAAVSKQVQSDATLKKTALNEALAALGNPDKAAGTDAVTSLFVDFFKRKQEEAKKDATAEKKVTDKELAALNEQIDAFAARFSTVKNIDELVQKARSAIPKTYKGSLQKAFLQAQAQAMLK